ncbi:MAG TPA: adenosylhomocysteinase [Thermoplasmata archaeon]|nr:adenosylhomocysteinase [Thermoplasmata archaeon]
MAGDRQVGDLKIRWARDHMPVLGAIRARFEREKPLRGLTLSAVLHVEAKTAELALTLRAGGATVHLAAGNPLSTDDDVVAGLLAEGIDTRARKGESTEEYTQAVHHLLEVDPELIIDDGADLVALAHTARSDRGRILGSTEETTTGVIRLRALEAAGKLRFPAIDVNDAEMKHLFDNRFGGGQSILEGIFHATNLLIAGRTCVVAGFGWSGKGLAPRLRGLGADVIVTEIDPVRALEARLDGFRVMPMAQAAPLADFIVTVTGQRDVVGPEVLPLLKDRCVLANAGHFDVEVSRAALLAASKAHRTVRPQVEEFSFADGRRVFLLSEGRLVNLASGQGHPVEIMDLSFALQALSTEHLALHSAQLAPKLYPVPPELDRSVAEAALPAFGVALDRLTPAQQRYARSWEVGT